MKKFKPSLISVLAMTMLLLNVLMLGIFMISNYFSYEALAQKQSAKLLTALHERTMLYFDDVLNNAAIINELVRDQVDYNKTYDKPDLSKLEDALRVQVRNLQAREENISVISYGDEKGRYLGFRVNSDGTINLMLKDQRTGGKLTIFSSDTGNSQPLEIYQDYEVQTRPWYAPAKESQMTQWSDIYINKDEKMELAISVLSPLVQKGTLQGVVASDISLGTLNTFLKEDKEIGNGVIYFVDKDSRLIAHSGNENYIKSQDAYNENVELPYAREVDNEMIALSMDQIQSQKAGGLFSYKDKKQRYFGYAENIKSQSNLDLKIIIVIPEKDLLADIKNQQVQSVVSIYIIVLMSLILGVFALTKIVSPIDETIAAAKKISEGDFSVDFEEHHFNLYETHELTTAFNQMAHRLQAAFATIRDNERNLEKMIWKKTAELESTYDKLIESEKLASLGSLVAGISHEINTPLGVAVSASSYLSGKNKELLTALQAGKISKEAFVAYMHTSEESLDIIQGNLDRASSLIQSFKQISVDQSNFSKTDFFVREYLEAIFVALKHEYKNKNIQYHINCDEKIHIYSYPGAFSQIFTNFIMNSIKHGLKNDEVLVIDINVTKNEKGLVMVYKDNGRGINKQDLKHIFEPFFTTKRGHGGSGLGLSIVYNIVTSTLEGSIVCESEMDRGTMFNLDIPVALKEREDD